MNFDPVVSFLVALGGVKVTVNLSRGSRFVQKSISFALLAAVLSGGVALAKEPYCLKTSQSPGLRSQKVSLEVQGELKLNSDGKKVTRAPLKVQGELLYDERLSVPGAAAKTVAAVRAFEKADAVIQIGEIEYKTTLGQDRCLIALQKTPEEASLFSPYGPLTREQLELVDIPSGRVILSEFLPGKDVTLDESWPLEEAVLCRFLCLDAITDCNVKATLKSVSAGVAQVQFEGKVTGTAGGVASEAEMKGKYNFDLKSAQITWIGFGVREDRSIGHAEPGFETLTKVSLVSSPISHSQYLSDKELAKFPLQDAAASSLVQYESPKAGFQLLLDRRWRVMTNRTDLTVLRLVNRGDLVAQCNVSVLPDLPSGKQVTMDELQADIKQSLEGSFQEFLEATQSVTDDGLRVLRVLASGQSSDLPIHWIYYLISNEQGKRAAFVFTLEAKLAESFGAADRALTSTFQFRDRPATESPGTSSPPLASPSSNPETAQKAEEKTNR